MTASSQNTTSIHFDLNAHLASDDQTRADFARVAKLVDESNNQTAHKHLITAEIAWNENRASDARMALMFAEFIATAG